MQAPRDHCSNYKNQVSLQQFIHGIPALKEHHDQTHLLNVGNDISYNDDTIPLKGFLASFVSLQMPLKVLYLGEVPTAFKGTVLHKGELTANRPPRAPEQ